MEIELQLATAISKPSQARQGPEHRRRKTGVKSGIPLPHHAALDKDETVLLCRVRVRSHPAGHLRKAHSIISPALAKLAIARRGPCGEAGLYLPLDVAFDSRNDLYTCDSGSNRIRKVDHETASSLQSSAPGSMGSTEMVRPARSISPGCWQSRSTHDVMYIADTQRTGIRPTDPRTGMVTTVAGT